MDKIIVGTVIALADCKEADQLVTVATAEYGRLVLYGRGLKKMASKNAAACRLFSDGEFLCDYADNLTRCLLKSATLKNGRPNLQTDYLRLALASLVIEIAAKMQSDDPVYAPLQACLNRIEEDEEPYTAASLYVARILDMLGMAPVVDECAQCGSTDHIEAISLADGGFICHSCNQSEQQPVLPVAALHQFRVINKADFSVYDKLLGLGLNQWPLLQLMLSFLCQYSGISLRSLRSLNSLHSAGQ